MTVTALPGYSHISEVVDIVEEDVIVDPGPQGPRRLRQGGLWASAAFLTLLLVAALMGSRSSIVHDLPKESFDTVLTRDALAESGLCGYGVDCSKESCCTKSGYKCVEKSSWWSACVKVTSEVEEANSEEDEEEAPAKPAEEEQAQVCSDAGKSCTKTKCCSDDGYSCTKRTAIWWESTCQKTTSSHAAQAKKEKKDKQEKKETWAEPAGEAAEKVAPACAENGEEFPSMVAAQKCAQKFVKTLSIAQKVSMLHGKTGGMGYAGYLEPKGVNSKQGAMRLTMNDGPQGYNGYQEIVWGKATQFPDLIAVAGSFDTEAAKRYGAAIAEEFKHKGCNVLLGPDVEVIRSQLSGRTFETLSGEDPFLGSQLAQAYVHEVQKRGIIATAKHWLDNNQETDRQKVNVEVSDRAQHEIYMQPFQAAFEAGAGAVMCSYNSVYGEHACQNKKLLKTLLRENLGFRGYVVSDWGATHDAAVAALNGLDVEMPEATNFKHLPDLINSSDIPQVTVDDMVVHVLASMYAAGQFDGRYPEPKEGAMDAMATSDEHRAVARQIIIDSAVLLKNEGSTLPLQLRGKKVALVGKYCNQTSDKAFSQGSVYSGGGSGYVDTHSVVPPLKAIEEQIMKSACRSSEDSGEEACHYPTWLKWSPDASAGAGADVAVVCAAAHAEEGWDRKHYDVPDAKELVAALRLQPGLKKVVVLVSAPGAVTSEWVESADAALLMFMPGEQVGPAVAALLLGGASPGGRLPVSLPKTDEHRFTGEQYPGVQPKPHKNAWGKHLQANFSEGVLVGYRWNDAKGVPARFPFGFGLSYTDFRFGKFEVACEGKTSIVSFVVANVGDRAGTAVPQLYVSFQSLRPVRRQLRAFRKVELLRGGEATVVFRLGVADWSSYDEGAQKWISALDNGEKVEVSVGSSSTDLQWTKTLDACGHSYIPMKQ
mmetsp:Transcript_92397/g.206553  ORF Transcript_92397/g.206553 Transcript_92397/m.206553 type:complete len:934 (+) Transcript_92397:77-2878(+)